MTPGNSSCPVPPLKTEEEMASEQSDSGAQDAAIYAELMADYQRLRAELEALAASPYFRRAMERKRILYLPAGRVCSVPGDLPEMDFVVTARTAELLNAFALTCFNNGHPPKLDLQHDRKTKLFEIGHFEFEPEVGVWAIGEFTPLGRRLRDQGRISGVSISTMLAPCNNNQPVNLAFEVKSFDANGAHFQRARATVENLSIMGAILIDDAKSALQPYVSDTEKWKRILEGMAATQLSPELTTKQPKEKKCTS